MQIVNKFKEEITLEEKDKYHISIDTGEISNQEDEIFNPIKSDNEAMGFHSNNKKWELNNKPNGIKYIGYGIVIFFIIVFVCTIVFQFV